MSDLQVKNDTVSTIQVTFPDGAHAVVPGHSRVTTDIGDFFVSKGKVTIFHGAFSGIANVEAISEETGVGFYPASPFASVTNVTWTPPQVDSRFFVMNKNTQSEVVVTYGAHVDRIPPIWSSEFTNPGKYTMSFSEKNTDNSETLRAIVVINFPDDVDNVTLIIV